MSKNEENKLSDAIMTLHQEIVKQGAKMNLVLSELRTSYTKLDARVAKLDASFNKMSDNLNKMSDNLNKYAQRNDERADDHETRIERLEGKTDNSYAREPFAKYKKKKRK